MYSIDLNSDMGECFGAYKLGGDERSSNMSQQQMQHVAGMQAIRW